MKLSPHVETCVLLVREWEEDVDTVSIKVDLDGLNIKQEKQTAPEKAKEILIGSFGGYTIQEADGGWIDDNGTIYQEYSIVIHLSDTTADQVHSVCDELLKEFNQSSILIHENRTTAEFYSGK